MFFFSLSVSTAGAGESFAQSSLRAQITAGFGSFQFADARGNADKPIRVWFYRPQTLRTDSPVVFVMHGVARDAERYCREWVPYAQRRNFLLICPEFDAQNYSTQAYQRGNMFDQSKRPIPASKWTFTAIEHLFDYVKASTASSREGYSIYGHSAGGQFVHRFALFMPDARYDCAIAANPGWYTMPNYSGHKFPYGLRDANFSEQSLRLSFARHFVLLLGQEDTDADDPEIRKTDFAEDQGATRFQRGQNYFNAARAEAARLGAQFGWQLQTVPGAGHSDAQMAQAAVAIFFGK